MGWGVMEKRHQCHLGKEPLKRGSDLEGRSKNEFGLEKKDRECTLQDDVNPEC